jgi:hypothetical protein
MKKYRFGNLVRPYQNVVVPEAHNTPPVRFEEGGASCVISVVMVLTAVQFND